MSSIPLSSTLSTSSTATPAATSGPPASGGGGGGGPTSSPLLFFVALGFGVVFTNLWIIVGVKYCFRYNQRNRRALADETGEPIDMNTLPRTHRRRREKKLMTMDEVNERFPTLKYKAWMTARAAEGLPTAGGVAAPSESKAASLHNVDGAIAESKQSQDLNRPVTPAPKQSSVETGPNVSPESTTKGSPQIDTGVLLQSPTHDTEKKNTLGPHDNEKGTLAATDVTVGASTENVDDEMDEYDQIQMAVPTSMMAMGAGDSCAICIEILEDDEDVRGLSCGHTFHAHCLDPWLTSRRACCPLCKADYYVPKPRPEGEVNPEAERHERGRRQGGSRMDMPHPPHYAFQRNRRGRLLFPGRFTTGAPGASGALDGTPNPRNRFGFPTRLSLPQRLARSPPQPQPQDAPAEGQQPNRWRSRVGAMVPTVRTPRFMRRSNNSSNNTTPDAAAHTTAPETHHGSTPTPGQLEAGQQ